MNENDFSIGDRVMVTNVDDFSAKEKLELLNARGTVTGDTVYFEVEMDKKTSWGTHLLFTEDELTVVE
jgi:hypothetical protein